MSNMLEMIEDLPVYTLLERNKELGRPEDIRRKAFQNDLCVQLNRLMDHFGFEAADLVRGTSLSFSTISGWINNKVEVQLLDSNVKEIARFLGVSVDFLAFGCPMTERDFEIHQIFLKEDDKTA